MHRGRIIRDIFLNWVEENEGKTTPDAEEAFIRRLQAMPEWELSTYWWSTVGEWLESRDDLNLDLETEWANVCADLPTTYGFVATVDPSFCERVAVRLSA